VTARDSRSPAHRRFDAVVFDLDGVLVDSEPWWHETRLALAAEHGLTWTEDDSRAVMGPNSLGWARIMRDRRAFPYTDEGLVAVVVDRLVARYVREPGPVIAGAADAVRRIAATMPVAIASSSHPRVIEAAVDALGLHGVFSRIVSSDEVVHGKPAPDVYLLAAARLRVEPRRCLVVEDSYNGVRAGRAAGMAVALVPSALAPPAPGTHGLASGVVARLADLDPATFPA
jgi:HAD superfamily hydrolase (TIGR01509 family)